MEKQKFVVIDVMGMTGKDLGKQMNELDAVGYKRVFESDLTWYQGTGESGVVVFERKDPETVCECGSK